MRPEFGIFEPIFQSPHGYLALLNLNSADSHDAVALVQKCCTSVPDPFPDIYNLLSDPNWRPHLVAAVTVILAGFNSQATTLLWRQLDCGSWVTPQLAAALFIVDPDFSSQARARLEAKCPIDTSESRRMSPEERHSATGPAGTIDRSAKAAAALLELASIAAPVPSWLQELRSSPDLKALLALDIDASARIASRWFARIQEIKRSILPP